MKHLLLSLAIVFTLLGLFYCLTSLSAHSKSMEQYSALTTMELKAWSELFDPGWAESPIGIIEAKLPQALSSSPTSEAIMSKYGGDPTADNTAENTFGIFQAIVMKIDDGSSSLTGIGFSSGHLHFYELGTNQTSLRNFEKAKRYLEAAVRIHRANPEQCKGVLRALVVVEPDPARAALLLRLSCQGANPFTPYHLFNAYTLCSETESTELAAHYLDRLYTEYPAMAQEYADNNEIPDRKPAE